MKALVMSSGAPLVFMNSRRVTLYVPLEAFSCEGTIFSKTSAFTFLSTCPMPT